MRRRRRRTGNGGGEEEVEQEKKVEEGKKVGEEEKKVGEEKKKKNKGQAARTCRGWCSGGGRTCALVGLDGQQRQHVHSLMRRSGRLQYKHCNFQFWMRLDMVA